MRAAAIGFTAKPAREFFGLPRQSGAQRLIDVRLRRVPQLAGFARRDDLAYVPAANGGTAYAEEPPLAPAPGLPDGGRKRRRGGARYERDYPTLPAARRVEGRVPRELIDGAVLLCSEAAPGRCHRRLAADGLARQRGRLDIVHRV